MSEDTASEYSLDEDDIANWDKMYMSERKTLFEQVLERHYEENRIASQKPKKDNSTKTPNKTKKSSAIEKKKKTNKKKKK
ncbi:Protein CBG26454 [Caenorhabditis briggsae]|uniref:Uncharacterized protein n=2 Tax=Caenorhabditis briggsae TaxID=6238 RepID=A0AAE9D6J7_CAEBR|nr:Protein CBG26454 [Caenorhabditis briggsae]ULT96815.1 hypothetical protein L3Y34_004973 [Caenorhabditis briggsae]UMM29987.1 hypothetical protein L5515_012067 [Caenorhabditis briggsae]CAS00471.1 Protein CBG26454 [Caenorhabditis briggsae]